MTGRRHWTRRRPSTTVTATPRVSAPSARERDPHWRRGDPWPSQFKNAVRITVEEATILQGFRLDYPWQGSRTRRFLQIGNAVCPPMARLMVEAAARATLAAEDRR